MTTTNENHLILAPRLFDGDSWLQDHGVIIENDEVAAIIPASQAPTDLPTTRLEEGFLTAGFVDLQVNGGGGVMFNNAPSAETVKRIAAAHRTLGTTSLMPTFISDTPEQQRLAVEAVRSCLGSPASGVLGIHLEGPFFNPERRGTHLKDMIRPMNAEDLAWLSALDDVPVMLTLAPECVAAGEIQRLVAAGVRVCAGHTNASFEQIRAAIDEGLLGFTHLYNAMSPQAGRKPGTVGAALASDEAWAGIIADGHHVHPANIRLAHRAKPAGKLFLVSDAMSTVGGPDNSFEIYGERIQENNGRLVNAQGNLAGSAIALIDAIRYSHQQVGMDLAECLRMGSLYPAAFLGMDSRLGRIAPGYRADLVHINKQFHATRSWVCGKLAN